MTTLCVKICDILVNIGYHQYELTEKLNLDGMLVLQIIFIISA